MNKKLTVVFIPVLLVLLTSFSLIVFGQESDTLLKLDDLEFTDIGPEKGPADTIIGSPKIKEEFKLVGNVPSEQVSNDTDNAPSIWAIFIAGFLGGIAALIMPCIFPMLPLTISYFTKSAKNRRTAILKALTYGISIITIYVVFGILITIIFGADALNSISTNGIFNFTFFILLLIFSASFFGAFELTLPSNWINRADARSNDNSWMGIFFMAATLALVSFSCTGPIVGTLLVQAATTGALLAPSIGMLGFSLAIAIPFTVFASFPGFLRSLPKSGGWLNSVKIVLGFLELALALKFLSNVDLAYHWNWFDREVFLSLWITIFGLMGLYLIGKLRFVHDSQVSTIAPFRILIAIIVFSFVIYMVPGLWGAPLKSISAFLPPQSTQDFDLNTRALTNNKIEHNVQKHKYSDIFHAPLNLNTFFDYDEALMYAKDVNKPILVDFTGHACVNCREMEATVWTDPEIYRIINEEYVLVQLYVDDKTELPENEQIITPEGKRIKNIGNKWANLQIQKFNSNSQPCYALLDAKGNLLNPTIGATNITQYKIFLQKGLENFNANFRHHNN